MGSFKKVLNIIWWETINREILSYTVGKRREQYDILSLPTVSSFYILNTSVNAEKALATKMSRPSPLHYDKIQNRGIVH